MSSIYLQKERFMRKLVYQCEFLVLQEYLRHIMKPFSLFRIILVFRVLYILMIFFLIGDSKNEFISKVAKPVPLMNKVILLI